MKIRYELILLLSKFKAYIGLVIGILYFVCCGFMMYYIYKTPDRKASNAKIHYLEYVITSTKNDEIKETLEAMIISAESDGVLTNNEFEVVLTKYKTLVGETRVVEQMKFNNLLEEVK